MSAASFSLPRLVRRRRWPTPLAQQTSPSDRSSPDRARAARRDRAWFVGFDRCATVPTTRQATAIARRWAPPSLHLAELGVAREDQRNDNQHNHRAAENSHPNTDDIGNRPVQERADRGHGDQR